MRNLEMTHGPDPIANADELADAIQYIETYARENKQSQKFSNIQELNINKSQTTGRKYAQKQNFSFREQIDRISQALEDDSISLPYRQRKALIDRLIAVAQEGGLSDRENKKLKKALLAIAGERPGLRVSQNFEAFVDSWQQKKQIEERSQQGERAIQYQTQSNFLTENKKALVAYSGFDESALRTPVPLARTKAQEQVLAEQYGDQILKNTQLPDTIRQSLPYQHFLAILSCDSDDDVIGYMASLNPEDQANFEGVLQIIENGGWMDESGKKYEINAKIYQAFLTKLQSASQTAAERHTQQRAGGSDYPSHQIRLIQVFFNTQLALQKQSGSNDENSYIAIDGKLGSGDIAQYETNRLVMALELESAHYPSLTELLNTIPERHDRRDVIVEFSKHYLEGKKYHQALTEGGEEMPSQQALTQQYGQVLALLINEKLDPDDEFVFKTLPISRRSMQIAIPKQQVITQQKSIADQLNSQLQGQYQSMIAEQASEKIKTLSAEISTIQKQVEKTQQGLEEVRDTYQEDIEKMGTEVQGRANLLSIANRIFEEESVLDTTWKAITNNQVTILSQYNQYQKLNTKLQDKYFELCSTQFQTADLLGAKGEKLKKAIVLIVIKFLGPDYLQQDRAMYIWATNHYEQTTDTDTAEHELIGLALGECSRGEALTQSPEEQSMRDVYAWYRENVKVIQNLSIGVSYDANTYKKLLGRNYPEPLQRTTKLREVTLLGNNGSSDGQSVYMDFQALYDHGIKHIDDITKLIPDDAGLSDIKLGFVHYDAMKVTHPEGYSNYPYKKTVYKPQLDNLMLCATDDITGDIISLPIPPILFGRKGPDYISYRINHHKQVQATQEQVDTYFQGESEKAQALAANPMMAQFGSYASQMQTHYQPFFQLVDSLQQSGSAVTEDMQQNIYNMKIPKLLQFNQQVSTMLGNRATEVYIQKLNISEVMSSMGLYDDPIESEVQALLGDIRHLKDFFDQGGGAQQVLLFLQNKKNLNTVSEYWRDRIAILAVVIFVSISVMMSMGGAAGIFLGAAAGILSQEATIHTMNAITASKDFSPHTIGDTAFETTYEHSSAYIQYQRGEIDTGTMLQSYGGQFLKQIVFQIGAMGFGKFVGGPLRAKTKFFIRGQANAESKAFLEMIETVAQKGTASEKHFFGKFLAEYSEEMGEEGVFEQIAGEIHPAGEYLVMMFSSSRGAGDMIQTPPIDAFGMSIAGRKQRSGKKVLHIQAEYTNKIEEIFNTIQLRGYTADRKEDGTFEIKKIGEIVPTLVIEPTSINKDIRDTLGSYTQYIEKGNDGDYQITNHTDKIKHILQYTGGYVLLEEKSEHFIAEDMQGNTLRFEHPRSLETSMTLNISELQKDGRLEEIRTTSIDKLSEDDIILRDSIRHTVMGLPAKLDHVRLEMGRIILGKTGDLTEDQKQTILQAHQAEGITETYTILAKSGLFTREEMRKLTFWGVCGSWSYFGTPSYSTVSVFGNSFAPPFNTELYKSDVMSEFRSILPEQAFMGFMGTIQEAGITINPRIFTDNNLILIVKELDTELIDSDKLAQVDTTYDEKERNLSSGTNIYRYLRETTYNQRPPLVNFLLQYSFNLDSDMGFGKCPKLPKTMNDSLADKGGCMFYTGGQNPLVGYTKIDQSVPTSIGLVDQEWEFVSYTDILSDVMMSVKKHIKVTYGRNSAGSLTKTQQTKIANISDPSETIHPLIEKIGFNQLGYLTIKLQNGAIAQRHYTRQELATQSDRSEMTVEEGVELLNDMSKHAKNELGTDKTKRMLNEQISQNEKFLADSWQQFNEMTDQMKEFNAGERTSIEYTLQDMIGIRDQLKQKIEEIDNTEMKEEMKILVREIIAVENTGYLKVADFCRSRGIESSDAVKFYRQHPYMMKYADVEDLLPPSDMKPSMVIGQGANAIVLAINSTETLKIPKHAPGEFMLQNEAAKQEIALQYLKKAQEKGEVSDRIHIPQIYPHLADTDTPYIKMKLVNGLQFDAHAALIIMNREADLSSLQPRQTEEGPIDPIGLHDVLKFIQHEETGPRDESFVNKQKITITQNLEEKFSDIANRKEKLFNDNGAKDGRINTFIYLKMLGEYDQQKYGGLYQDLIDTMHYFLTQEPSLEHRDISPNNIMLAYNEDTGQYDLYIIDFGIAEIVGEEKEDE